MKMTKEQRAEIEVLFEPARYVPTTLQEERMTKEQIVQRGQMMMDLMGSPAWTLLDSKVSEITEALLGQIDDEKEPLEIKKIQGRISGIRALRVAILTFVDQAKEAHKQLQENTASDKDA